jgi:hypothetical protein
LGFQTFDDAEKACRQQENGSSLISIRFLEEQEFLSGFLFKTHKVVDNIWIGAKYTSNKFEWTDDSDLVFTNWAEGSPKNKTDHCVQLQADETSVGKWSDVLCDKKNLVVCQKMQTWPLSQLQKILLNTIKNPFPIGFIYVQLPNEKSPTEIWPWMIWNDVSSAYAGVFFRVIGGEAGNFGQVQRDNAPHLQSIENNYGMHCKLDKINTVIGGASDWINFGQPKDDGVCTKVSMSGGEVRPLNMAIRVWKRAG